ncbi:acetylornithine deacetylase succinyl-diaminopimelate desuccinylase-like protein [Secundilactobacillus kimchicus JCM 15530]|uniref:Probable succinyl-diaminopimelate desuccinylase n=1 Tax=Secundilactobacillus kimchicus JCM 15530 TaxID=1302272 RepID=A0A0R1HY24_9LACO|nr:ArgE/DapE family deacylase [Secundilactobacillus kimchicus]KRK47767.1 acetylornithine deacetylase succinyl-diaminopimelate desuccinylase-like protein [Secundilactobacillus kimchicus JCM 15530]
MTPEEQVQVLKDLIAIPSENGGEAAVADYLAAQFTRYSAAHLTRVPYAPGRDNLVVTIGDQTEGPQLGFSGHMDVVAAGDAARWQTPPFTPSLRAGRLYGRGASDMKSGLAAMTVALLNRLAAGRQPTGGIRLLATVGEETGEFGAAQLTKLGAADGLDALVIGEPTGLTQVAFAAKGVIDYTVTATGKAAHSAIPSRGNNAIDQLMTYYVAANELMAGYRQADAVLGQVTHSVNLISGGEQINSVPELASLSANVRTTPVYPTPVVMADLQDLVNRLNQRAGMHLTLQFSYPEDVMTGRYDAPFIKLIQKVGRRALGHVVTPVGSGGANDGSEFRHAGQFPIAVIGPGSGTGHEVNEYVTVDQYLAAVRFYEAVIEEFFEK